MVIRFRFKSKRRRREDTEKRTLILLETNRSKCHKDYCVTSLVITWYISTSLKAMYFKRTKRITSSPPPWRPATAGTQRRWPFCPCPRRRSPSSWRRPRTRRRPRTGGWRCSRRSRRPSSLSRRRRRSPGRDRPGCQPRGRRSQSRLWNKCFTKWMKWRVAKERTVVSLRRIRIILMKLNKTQWP